MVALVLCALRSWLSAWKHHRSWAPLLAVVALLGACSGGDDANVPPEGAVDGGPSADATSEGGGDPTEAGPVPEDGASAETSIEDGATDAGADALEDAATDASQDASQDATQDASQDATQDATQDAVGADASDAAPDAPVDAASPITITLDPTSVTLDQGAVKQLAATVSNTANGAVDWSVVEGSAGGDVSVTGEYTAPKASGTFHVKATSVADNTKSATVTVYVNAVAITLAPTGASVAPSQSTGFVATVSGTVDARVEYSVDPGGVGGTINQLGVYYAPAATGGASVRAKSLADPTKSATASVTVTSTIGVTVTPAAASLGHGQTQSFAASVTGTANGAVTWSVVGSPANGTISPAGVYSAPATNGTFTVVATSAANGTTQGTATVTVSAAPQVAVAIAPSSVTLSPGEARVLSASVTGTANDEVDWSVLEATGGAIDAAGRYVAPAAAGTYHVVATSVADPTKTAIATVAVSTGPPVAVTINPTAITLPPSGTKTFAATVTGSANGAVSWSASCGAVDASGSYTAPSSVPSYCVVTATSAADATKSASAAVTVTSTIAVTVAPSPMTVASGSSHKFTATVTGSANTAVTWSVVGAAGTGSIDQSGVYTTMGASATPPYSVTIKATSQADGTTFGQATANVIASTVKTVSGTVSYPAGTADRIFINVVEHPSGQEVVGGTMITAPGPFTIRCLRNQRDYRLVAWNDKKRMIALNRAADQSGTSAPFTFSGADVTGVNVTLTDPTPSIPTAAPQIKSVVSRSSKAASLMFSRVVDAGGYDVADHYRVYVSTALNPGPQNHVLTRTVTGGGSEFAVLSPLVDGTAYYFGISAVNAAGEGPRATTAQPIVVGPATGGSVVSGTIDMSGIVATGPLYVYATIGGEFYGTKIDAPGAIANYSISGVPNGVGEVGAILDQGGDGDINQIDPRSPFKSINVSGNLNVPLSFVSGNARPTVATEHQMSEQGFERYALSFAIAPNRKMPVRGVLLGGPNTGTNIPIDIGVSQFGEPDIELRWFDVGLNVPLVGDTYSFAAEYDDGTAEGLSAPVTGVLGLATNLTPSTTGVGTTPGFSWTPPGGSYRTSLVVSAVPWSGAYLWQLDDIPSAQTLPIAYGGSPLALGTQYQWWVYLRDGNGNSSSAGKLFTP